MKIYLTGGAIRDELLGIKSKDNDFVVEAPSYAAMREMIIARGGKIFLETEKFLTIRANVPELGSADYVLARKDGAYSDSRRPDSVEVGTIEDDLSRRDFTVNAMAKDVETGALLDPHNGVNDIEHRLIRCVGDAEQRFNEDTLRVIRALRFAVTKQFRFEENTLDAMLNLIKQNRKRFEATSTERIREELLKMFSANTIRSITLLNDFGLWWLVEERGIWLKPTIENRP